MPANENLYTYEKETDILFCLNISLYIFLFFFFYFVVRLSKKNYGIVHRKIQRTMNLKQRSSVACASDCLESAHFKIPFYSVTES